MGEEIKFMQYSQFTASKEWFEKCANCHNLSLQMRILVAQKYLHQLGNASCICCKSEGLTDEAQLSIGSMISNGTPV